MRTKLGGCQYIVDLSAKRGIVRRGVLFTPIELKHLAAGGEIALADIIFSNMIPVTLGNIVGGGLILGAGFWYAYRSK